MKFVFLTNILVIALTGSVLASRDREHITSGTTNYQTEDGIERHEELEADGSLKGHYSYVDPNGKRVSVNYVAGKDGFKASGNHFAVFNLGNTHLENDDSGVYTSGVEDSHSHSSYNVHKKVSPYSSHKEVSSYTPEHEYESSSYNKQEDGSSYIQSHSETPAIQYEIQKPRPRPQVHYRPAPVQHYKPEIHESYETHANLYGGGKNEQAVSYINQENEQTNEHVTDEDEEENEEEEHAYSTYRPPASKPYFTTKAPTYQPTFKPYYHEETPETEQNPITTKFVIKHPVGSVHNSESYSNSENQHKFGTSSVEYPDVKTKTTYHTVTDESHYNKPSFESTDHLNNFDTTKLLNDYHNNKPSVSQLPHFPTTKFTIEDVSAPSHGQAYLPKPVKDYSFDDFKTDKAPEYTFSHHFKSEKTPEYNSNDFKSQKAPEYSLTKFNEFSPENFKQPDFSNFFKTESSYSLNDFSKGKPQEAEGHIEFLNTKNPANLGQYQQYLKSTEDEKIEQQFIRDQLKFKQPPTNKQRTRPSYSRPNLNTYHPGRRPPKRPSSSPGLGTFRTTFKIPYGFHI